MAIAIGPPVHKFVGLKIVFRDFRAVPSLGEIVIEERIQAIVIVVLAKHIFRHRVDVQTGVIMLQPDGIPQYGQFHMRRVRVEFELNRLLPCFEPFTQLDGPFHLLN